MRYIDWDYWSGPGSRLAVAEGHVRLTAYVMARDAASERIPVLLGRAPAVVDWPDY